MQTTVTGQVTFPCFLVLDLVLFSKTSGQVQKAAVQAIGPASTKNLVSPVSLPEKAQGL